MAISCYCIMRCSILLLFVGGLVLAVESSSSSTSFGFEKFEETSKILRSEIGFYGDAKVVKNVSFVGITRSQNYSAGRMMYRKPIKEFGKDGGEKVSFGTYFSFSLSQENGDGLMFVMLPSGFSSSGYDGKLFGLSNEVIERKNRAFFAVEIDTKFDSEFGDLNDNHVGVDVGSFVSMKATKDLNATLKLNSGEKLQCWIDYEASSKRIEVRISKAGEDRPVYPLVSCAIDLSKMFRKKEVFIGLSSSNSNSTQVCKLYSWSFNLRVVPHWMHSQPLDPRALSKDAEPVLIRRKSDCALKVLTALILGTGCGALGAYIVMFIWSIFVTKKPVVPEECMVKPVMYDYDKVEVVAVDKSDDCKK